MPKYESMYEERFSYIDDDNLRKHMWDTSGDIEAGKNVGIKTIWISRWFQDKNILKKSKPDFIIDDIKEVLETI